MLDSSKLSSLSTCKKLTSSLTPFLIHCKEIPNLLFRVIWACLATHTQNDSINLKKPLMSIYKQKKNSSVTFSLRYCKDMVNLFWILWACLATNTQRYYQLVQTFHVYQHAKYQLHTPCFSGDIGNICKLILDFGYFGHAWLYTPSPSIKPSLTW